MEHEMSLIKVGRTDLAWRQRPKELMEATAGRIARQLETPD
jgi:hypothetical protein